MFTSRLVSVIWATCLVCVASAQSLHYDALRKDKIVGGMDILVRQEGTHRIFHVESHMEFRFLISLKVNFVNEETFEEGVLQKGFVKNEMIGFKESEANITKTNLRDRVTGCFSLLVYSVLCS